jgi:hypothetical protein
MPPTRAPAGEPSEPVSGDGELVGVVSQPWARACYAARRGGSPSRRRTALMAATETVEGRTATGVKEQVFMRCHATAASAAAAEARLGSSSVGGWTDGRTDPCQGRNMNWEAAVNGAGDRPPAFTTTSLSGLGASTPLVLPSPCRLAPPHACLAASGFHRRDGGVRGLIMCCFFFSDQHSAAEIVLYFQSFSSAPDAEIAWFGSSALSADASRHEAAAFSRAGGRSGRDSRTDRRGERWLPLVFRCRCRELGDTRSCHTAHAEIRRETRAVLESARAQHSPARASGSGLVACQTICSAPALPIGLGPASSVSSTWAGLGWDASCRGDDPQIFGLLSQTNEQT